MLLLSVSFASGQEVDVKIDYNAADSVLTIRIKNVFGSELALENICPLGGGMIETGSCLMLYRKDSAGGVSEMPYYLGPKRNWKKRLIPLKTDKEEIWIYKLTLMKEYKCRLESVFLHLVMPPVLSDGTVDMKRDFDRVFEWAAK